jgi:uncharacterized protein YegP (UPF0339 family)
LVSKFEVYADKSGKYRWRLKATNGQTVASSGEPFASKTGARNAAKRVQANSATKYAYESYAGKTGKFRWRATASNGQTVAVSGESFSSKGEAGKAARAAKATAGKATVA